MYYPLGGADCWRKTTLFMSLAVETAVTGKVVVWGAPTFAQVNIGFEETRRAAGAVADFNIGRMTVTFPTGGQIIYRSLDDPDNARGFTADMVLIDEAGDVKPQAWHEVLRPMLIDTNGAAWIGGTPKGRNWFYKEFQRALYADDSAAWQVPTLGVKVENGRLIRVPHPLENPEIPFSEIQHLYDTLPYDTFRQEILAEFVEGEGQVFRNLQSCLNAPTTSPQQHTRHKLVAGIDIAKQHDYTAISIACVDCMQEVYLDRFNRLDYILQVQLLREVLKRWNVHTVLVDSTGVGDPVVEMLQRDLLK